MVKDEGKLGGKDPIFDSGLAYGWYRDAIEAVIDPWGGMIEEEEAPAVVVEVNEEESKDAYRKSEVDRFVCVLRCTNSSSLFTNRLPQ